MCTIFVKWKSHFVLRIKFVEILATVVIDYLLKKRLVLLVMQRGIFNRLQHDDKESTFLKNPTFCQRYC